MAPRFCKEHYVHYTARLYKDTKRENAMEFDDPLVSVRAPTQQRLKIVKHVAACSAGDINRVSQTDGHEKERSK